MVGKNACKDSLWCNSERTCQVQTVLSTLHHEERAACVIINTYWVRAEHRCMLVQSRHIAVLEMALHFWEWGTWPSVLTCLAFNCSQFGRCGCDGAQSAAAPPLRLSTTTLQIATKVKKNSRFCPLWTATAAVSNSYMKSEVSDVYITSSAYQWHKERLFCKKQKRKKK